MINPKNLLIVRTDRIGDVVLSLPIARLIKNKYPECKVTFLLRSYTCKLAEGNPFIDDIIILEEDNGNILLSENINKIKKNKYDAAIVVYPTFLTALIVFFANIKIRIGSGYRWYSILFNEKIYEHRKYAGKHELEYNVQLLEKMGIEVNVTPANVRYDLYPDNESTKIIEDFLRGEKIQSKLPVIIFHPGSGGSAIDLPVEKFKELVSICSKKLNAEIWITGSETEKQLCAEIVGNSNAKNFAGKFSLSKLIALINKCDIFVANSTGPIHIAAALGKHTIGFYPKILACSQQRWGPFTEKRVVFLPRIECTNCTREQCERLDCMSSINVEEVFESISEISKLYPIKGEKNV